MAKSQNGWPAAYQVGNQVYDTPPLTKLSWITGSVRSGDVWTVLNEVAKRFNSEVESINPAESWGFAPRPIRGSSTELSNHASGTAVDFNAPRHALGKVNTFSVSQRAAIRKILKDLDGVVRWGGDYTGRKDEMHFEVVGSAASVKKVADKIRNTVPIAPPKPVEENDVPAPILNSYRADRGKNPFPLKKGVETTVPLNDQGDKVTVVFGDHRPKRFHANVKIWFEGLAAGQDVDFRAQAVDIKTGVVKRSYGQVELSGTAGSTFREYTVIGDVPLGQRVRFFAKAKSDGVTIRQVIADSLEWNN